MVISQSKLIYCKTTQSRSHEQYIPYMLCIVKIVLIGNNCYVTLNAGVVLQEEPRSDSYRHAVQPPKTAGAALPKKKAKTKKDKKLELEELKQEVDMVSTK